MEKKEEKQKDNRFTYSSDEGLKVLSEKDILESIGSEKEIKKSEDNKLKGGKGDNLTVEDIVKKHNSTIEHIKKQIKMGLEVEMEHTNNPKIALEITMDHLTESPDYYTKLKQMEESFDKE